MRPRVAVISGDGIGAEVVEPAVAELRDVDVVYVEMGAERYLATGDLVTAEDLATLSSCDAILFGAVGDPRIPDGILERGIILRLRKELDLYVNLRPFPELDTVFVRENSEGLYAGVARRVDDSAFETSVNTRSAIERCVRYAFELAVRRSGRLTWVHKTNVLIEAGGLWREVVADVAAEHPDVALGYEHVDAAAYHLVVEPERFDVVVTDNLFGDILTDVAAGVAGGLGRASSANLHPDASTRPTRCIGLFEPVHGSAPDIAGKGLADPTAALRAAGMLMEEFSKENVTT
jgi:3-isopropylmalate dehydrogenase